MSEEYQSDGAFGKVSISLKLNGNESELSPMNFTVMIFDSIYQLYPKVKMSVSDFEGVLNEYLAFINGTQIEISLGALDSEMKSCPYVVAKNAVPQQKTSSSGTGGDFEIELIHEYFARQFRKSKAYESNISDIIKSLVSQYEFSSVNIENTINSGLWYQPFINDSEFMYNYLAPFAYSNSSEDTPFFTFIDSNNNFNFKSFRSMFMENPIKEMSFASGPDIIVNDTLFSSVNFSQVELSKIRPWFNTKYYSYDDKGEMNVDDDTILDYLNTTQGKYPMIGDSSNPTNIVSLYDYDVEQNDTENNNRGYLVNSHRDVITPDKIIINTILDKNLVCGKMLRINLPNVDSNATDENSLRNSGDYLIESSYHIWDGVNARTMLVCSKQNIKVTNDYRNNNLLMS